MKMVSSYLYVFKLNPDCPFLWQRPQDALPQTDNEFNAPLGVNTIANKQNLTFQRKQQAVGP